MNAENMPLYGRRNNNSTSLKKRGTVTLKNRPGTVTVNSGSNQLLLLRPRNSVNARTKDEILNAKVDFVIQQGSEAIAQMRAMMQSQAATEDTQARIQNVAEATKETQTIMKRVLDRVDVGVKQIGAVTNQILGITQRTEKLAKTFRNRGVRGIIQAVLFDEWLIFYMYMLPHPYAPTRTGRFGCV